MSERLALGLAGCSGVAARFEGLRRGHRAFFKRNRAFSETMELVRGPAHLVGNLEK